MTTEMSTSQMDTIILKGYNTPQVEYDTLSHGNIYIVGMNLTSECNYRCPYCFVGSENLKTTPDEISKTQKLSVITQAWERGARVLIICGKGEPFADSDIWDIIEKASSLDIWTIIYTNGSLIKKDMLSDLNKTNVSFMLKVDSLDPIDYLASTGHKPPQKDIRNWVLQLKENLPSYYDSYEDRTVCRLGINAVVSKANIHSIHKLSQFCREENILFSCRVVQKTGNAVKNWDQLVGKKLTRLTKIAKECTMRTVSSQSPNNSCSIYRYGVTIENNGDIYMCPNSRELQMQIGNVCEESLATLLKKRVEIHPLVTKPAYCFVRAGSKTTAD